jgi:glutaredoxin 3
MKWTEFRFSESMNRIVIYTTPFCGYCVQAKRLLTRKGVAFEEVDVSRDPEQRRTMVQQSGGRMTVPQIFVNGSHIGDCDEIYALEKAGKLDPLLSPS